MASRSKRAVLLSPLLVCGALGAGWWSVWPIRWVAQPAAAFPAALERTHTGVAAAAEAAPVGSFVHAGHRAGSFREFAKSLHQGDLGARRPVAELMDRAFDRLGLTSVEVDVRSSPLNERDVIVVHDAVDGARLDAAGRAYAERNTARSLIERFLAGGRHLEGRRIAFEVKAPRDGLDDATRAAVDRLARDFDDATRGRPDAGRVRAALDVISFSHAALERMHAALGANASAHGLYQIVTSDQLPEWLFRLGAQPPFGDDLKAKLREVPWLRGVFFDPRFVADFARLFNRINAEREARGLRALELHLSTLSHDLDAFVARLAAEPEPLRHVAGLIYEVDPIGADPDGSPARGPGIESALVR